MANLLLREFPSDAASLLEAAQDGETAALLTELGSENATAVLRRLTPDRAARVLGALDPAAARGTLLALPPGRAAALLSRLDPDERESRLAALDAPVAEELRALAAWPANSAGALMDPRVTTFRFDTPVSQALERLRRFRNRRVYDLFLVDEDGQLTGVVSLQDVALEDPELSLGRLSRGVPPSVRAVASREEVIETFESHRTASLPVVDFEGRLLGVLRQRELVQAAQEEATASAVTMTGASQDERALSPPWFAIRKRLPWLHINLVTAFLAAGVVGAFEGTIAKVTALAVLLPVVAGQSGNTGAQALAVTMRGLALREVRTRQWLPVVTKEALAGLGNGVAVASAPVGLLRPRARTAESARRQRGPHRWSSLGKPPSSGGHRRECPR
jgi:magnesium transporter